MTITSDCSGDDDIINDDKAPGVSVKSSSHQSLAKLLKAKKKTQRKSISSTINSDEFDKDDIALGHIEFVAATAYVRSVVYSLKTVSQLEVRRVAGI